MRRRPPPPSPAPATCSTTRSTGLPTTSRMPGPRRSTHPTTTTPTTPGPTDRKNGSAACRQAPRSLETKTNSGSWRGARETGVSCDCDGWMEERISVTLLLLHLYILVLSYTHTLGRRR